MDNTLEEFKSLIKPVRPKRKYNRDRLQEKLAFENVRRIEKLIDVTFCIPYLKVSELAKMAGFTDGTHAAVVLNNHNMPAPGAIRNIRIKQLTAHALGIEYPKLQETYEL